MHQFARAVIQFVKREDGPTAVEYAIMLALIVLVCFIAIQSLGNVTSATFSNVGAKMSGS